MNTFRMVNKTTLEVIERECFCDFIDATAIASAYEYGCADELEFYFKHEGEWYHYEWVAEAEDWLGEWGDYEWIKVEG